MNAIIDHPTRFSSVVSSPFQSKWGIFCIGVIVGISSFAGVLRFNEAEAEQTGNTTATPTVTIRDPGNVTPSTSNPSYSGALIPVVKGDTNSSLSNYQLERDACCPAE